MATRSCAFQCFCNFRATLHVTPVAQVGSRACTAIAAACGRSLAVGGGELAVAQSVSGGHRGWLVRAAGPLRERLSLLARALRSSLARNLEYPTL